MNVGNTGTYLVSLAGVSKNYTGNPPAPPVLNQVSLDLRRGDFLYVVGGTGAGKSSLLRLIATEDSASSGTVSLFGYSLSHASSRTLRSIRQTVGYIPQNVRLIPDLSVYENIALSVALSGGGVGAFWGGAVSVRAKSKIHELMDRLGLSQKRNKLAAALSGGEAQRVAVARALARSPELIVADEPTGAQDRDFTWSLMDLFIKANQGGATVVVATHDREIVRRVRKRCAMIQDGKVTLEDASCFY